MARSKDITAGPDNILEIGQRKLSAITAIKGHRRKKCPYLHNSIPIVSTIFSSMVEGNILLIGHQS